MQKSAVFTPKEWKIYNVKQKLKNNIRNKRLRSDILLPDAVNQVLRVSHNLPENINIDSKVAKLIIKDKYDNSYSNSANAYEDYKANQKYYDENLKRYGIRERFVKNGKIADLIRSNPKFVEESAAPMDNTIVVTKLGSTEISTPLQQLAGLSYKRPLSTAEQVLTVAPVAAPLTHIVGTGAAVPLATSMWTNPISWTTSTAGGVLGSEGVNSGVRLLSNNKYNSWGDMLGSTDIEKFILEFTNPGGWFGGIKGWNLGRGGDKAINTYRLARELNKSVKNFDGTVGESYFHAPDKWYRITLSPEIYGVLEQGINVTTTDLSKFPNLADIFRRFVLDNRLVAGKGKDEGYWIYPKKARDAALNKRIRLETESKKGNTLRLQLNENPRLFMKSGSAHGNRSLGAWQGIWTHGTAANNYFPRYVLEGNALPNLTIPFGENRVTFKPLSIDEVPKLSRIGFKTGEMPIEGLKKFRLLSNGRYLYEGTIIPDNRITIDQPAVNFGLPTLKPFHPYSHLLGTLAEKMFRDMLDTLIPDYSPLFQRLLKYAPEARIKYNLSENITDEQIATALYKSALRDFSGTAASNSHGEPLVLFRGDTKPYTLLLLRPSPQELAKGKGTMDNGFGTLFLGDFGKPSLTKGVDRYLVGWNYNETTGWNRFGGWDGFTDNMPLQPIPSNDSWRMYFGIDPMARRQSYVGFVKAPSKYSVTGTNDLNAFMVKTDAMRDASKEISVLNDDFLALLPSWKGPAVSDSPTREQVAKHIQKVLEDASIKLLGLLKSSKIDPKKRNNF